MGLGLFFVWYLSGYCVGCARCELFKGFVVKFVLIGGWRKVGDKCVFV